LLKDKLGLSDAIVEKTAYIYRKAEEKKLAKGRSIIAMLASALYIACRDTETSRTKDIAMASNIKLKDIARNYRLLIRELDIRVPIADPLKYTAKIANTAKLSEKTKRHAFNTMNEAIKKGNTRRKASCKPCSYCTICSMQKDWRAYKSG
jgi:transcription initiation factor TFIIB